MLVDKLVDELGDKLVASIGGLQRQDVIGHCWLPCVNTLPRALGVSNSDMRDNVTNCSRAVRLDQRDYREPKLIFLAAFLRTLGVARPLAPGSCVELAAFQAGDLHREQVVARRHAGAAVVDDFGRWAAAES